jgi:hypothetical protein
MPVSTRRNSNSATTIPLSKPELRYESIEKEARYIKSLADAYKKADISNPRATELAVMINHLSVHFNLKAEVLAARAESEGRNPNSILRFSDLVNKSIEDAVTCHNQKPVYIDVNFKTSNGINGGKKRLVDYISDNMDKTPENLSASLRNPEVKKAIDEINIDPDFLVHGDKNITYISGLGTFCRFPSMHGSARRKSASNKPKTAPQSTGSQQEKTKTTPSNSVNPAPATETSDEPRFKNLEEKVNDIQKAVAWIIEIENYLHELKEDMLAGISSLKRMGGEIFEIFGAVSDAFKSEITRAMRIRALKKMHRSAEKITNNASEHEDIKESIGHIAEQLKELLEKIRKTPQS